MTTVEERRKLKRQAPQVVLNDRHIISCRLLPTRERMLDLLPLGGIVAEVGVACGDFTREIMARSAPKKLHLIDVWSSARYEAGLDAVRAEFAEEISSGRIEINRGRSTERLVDFPDSYFDWIYIDTDHSYPTTRDELELAQRKVKSHGRIAGHDFTSGNSITPWPYGVIEACNEFCVKHAWGYEFLTIEPHGHMSFSLRKL